ncbi:tmem144B [Symbiodinium natans]|uniref:Tmem144B protein n=1 Tax=Symbiodinium natans TaxID=878477 RepID=A0A812VCS5_9DINO|nr:tmem144B [Symbiodinium natans]
MCSGILFVGLAAAMLGGDLSRGVPPKVVFGGSLWALSNFAVLPLVKLLGIGLGFSLYHFQNMIVGYVVGRNGLFGLPTLEPAFDGSLYVCDVGCCLILVSFVALLLVEGGEDTSKEKEADSSRKTPKTEAFEAVCPKPAKQKCWKVHGKGQLGETYEEVPAERHHRLLESSAFSAFALEVDEGDDIEEFSPEVPDVAEDCRGGSILTSWGAMQSESCHADAMSEGEYHERASVRSIAQRATYDVCALKATLALKFEGDSEIFFRQMSPRKRRLLQGPMPGILPTGLGNCGVFEFL